MRAEAAASLDLVLVGGGHAHALALRKLAMARPAALRITLISPDPFTPYSGMLPGLLAGHYRYEETHIDLMRLCQWAGVQFFPDTVERLDPVNRRLVCRARGEVGYDLLSIDIGSQPELDSVPGAREHAIPVKPVAGLWQRWQHRDGAAAFEGGPIAVVGGGAGSVELVLAIAQRLGAAAPPMALYSGASELLPGYPRGVRRVVERQLARMNISLHCGHRVSRVEAGRLYFEGREGADFHSLIWSTGASPAPWIAESGLPVDRSGFMEVNDALQSTAFDNIFGAGDIAVQVNNPRPKAGVFAVRQGPVLADNLLAASRGAPLKKHRPQSRFLSLLSLGDRTAVAERNGFSVSGAWVWRWKDRIDRTFMDRFNDLPPMAVSADTETVHEQAICGGCGAKVAADDLAHVLAELRTVFPDAAPAAEDLDDAVLISDNAPLLQSIDSLRAMVADPWRMGRIAAQHALSDLYASGAVPRSAQALVVLPFAGTALLRRDLRLVLSGALSVFSAAGCRLVGGHSMQGPELQLGFAVNGVLDGGEMLGKQGGQPGDRLILTRALGSGALFAAHMQLQADGRHIDAALTAMERGNADAARIARAHGCRALTDVTGFGLAGHLSEMLDETLDARIDLGAPSVYAGALEAMEQGVFSTLQESNRQAVIERCRLPVEYSLRSELLFDPQTSGGLLMAIPPERVGDALQALRASDPGAAEIGELLPATDAGGVLHIS